MLSDELDANIVADDIDCGDESVILDPTGEFPCSITDVTTGEVYDLTISTGGLIPGGGAKDVSFRVGELQD